MRRPGVLYMAASAALFSAMAVLVKLAGERLPAPEIILIRVVVTLILSWAMLRRARMSPWGPGTGRWPCGASSGSSRCPATTGR